MYFTTKNRPKRNQIGDRYQLWQNLSLLVGGKRKRRKVTDWIENHTIKLYLHVYEPKQHGLEPIKLSHEAAVELKKRLKVVSLIYIKR